MITPYIVSFCHYGILGGGMFFEDRALTYRTNKVTVAPEYRVLKMPYYEIESIGWRTIIFPIATFTMGSGENFSFIIFNKKRFEKDFGRIIRIMEMEAVYDKAWEVIENADENPADFMSFQKEIGELEKYYIGPEWKEDFAADEAGNIPKGIKRGILSEDAIYDLLEENKKIMDQNMIRG